MGIWDWGRGGEGGRNEKLNGSVFKVRVCKCVRSGIARQHKYMRPISLISSFFPPSYGPEHCHSHSTDNLLIQINAQNVKFSFGAVCYPLNANSHSLLSMYKSPYKSVVILECRRRVPALAIRCNNSQSRSTTHCASIASPQMRDDQAIRPLGWMSPPHGNTKLVLNPFNSLHTSHYSQALNNASKRKIPLEA